MIRRLLIGAAVFAIAAPAAAQTSPSWTGFNVGGRIGYVATPLYTGSRVLFDRGLDGQFGDTITTVTGANAFSPGFCNGDPIGPRALDGCESDSDGLDYAVHAGADYQFGSIVVGGLVEYGRSKGENSVTGFTTTPANYYLSRELRGTFGARARVGVDIQGTMPYVTAGVVRAKIRNEFTTSNTANALRSRTPMASRTATASAAGSRPASVRSRLERFTCSPTSRTTISASTSRAVRPPRPIRLS